MNLPFHYEGSRHIAGTSPVPSLERFRVLLHSLTMLGDVVMLAAAMELAGFLYLGEWLSEYSVLSTVLMVPIFIIISVYSGTYSLASLNRFRTAARRMVIALSVSAALLHFVAFFLRASEQLSRAVFALGFLIALCAMLAMRYAANRWIRRNAGPNLSNVLLIDAGGPRVSARNTYRIAAEDHGLVPDLEEPLALDRIGRAMANMDRVIVSCPPERAESWALVFRAAGVEGEIVSLAAHRLAAVGVRHGDSPDFSTLVVSKRPLGIASRSIKRCFDLGLAIGALVLLSPVMLTAALVIKLEDGGPIFFRQKRVGRGNRLFTIYKFRSMSVHRADMEGHRSTTREDDRVTRAGRLLRAWSIDELPQLWNIVRGEMSVVGPRPHALGSLAGSKRFWEVDRRYWQRHALKLGLTGLAQIRGLRGATDDESDLAGRLRADLEYLSGWSILRDIGIVISTLRVIVHERAF